MNIVLKKALYDFKYYVLRSILAGLFIGIASFGFLANSIVGTFLFILGLAAIIKYEAILFTGTAGYVTDINSVLRLIIIWGGNILGCLFVSFLSNYSPLPLRDVAINIVQTRENTDIIGCGLLSIGCGILMTTAVNFVKKDDHDITNWITLFFAIPLFIVCGFPHCIADSFYYMSAGKSLGWCYWITVLGNFIGCNIPRLLTK